MTFVLVGTLLVFLSSCCSTGSSRRDKELFVVRRMVTKKEDIHIRSYEHGQILTMRDVVSLFLIFHLDEAAHARARTHTRTHKGCGQHLSAVFMLQCPPCAKSRLLCPFTESRLCLNLDLRKNTKKNIINIQVLLIACKGPLCKEL